MGFHWAPDLGFNVQKAEKWVLCLTLRTIRELRNGAAPFPAVPSSFVDRNFLGAEIFLCVCVFSHLLCSLLSPVWAASISWALPPPWAVPGWCFSFLISGHCYLAKYFWPPPETPSRTGIHLFTLSPVELVFSWAFFPSPGRVKPQC